MSKKQIEINIPMLARVEGEGALDLIIENNKVEDLKLRIYEPPRFFEKFLIGRDYSEVIDIVARICGICPVAYQMSAVHAIEKIFKVNISPWTREMRRLFYCGEWIESHALHIHLLALPDYLGFKSAAEMAEKFPTEVKRGLLLQKVGNSIVSLLGARSVHPVGVRVGGFYRAPKRSKVKLLLLDIKQAINEAVVLINWLSTFNYPELNDEFICVSLSHQTEYPFNEGKIISSNGLVIEPEEFLYHFKEHQVPHSTALHCLLNNEPYLVGPLARINLNYNKLPSQVKDLMLRLPIKFPSNNMFHSMLARAIEIYYTLIEAKKILENYVIPDTSYADYKLQGGEGTAATEAPRGLLWHHYGINDEGKITLANIIPPTSQNQARIEQELHHAIINHAINLPDDEIRLLCEKIIRNYDPCISCSTHFLNLRIKRD